MNTKTTPGLRRRPLYKRKKFWLAVAAATLVAAGVATFCFTKEAGVSVNPLADQKDQGKVEVYTSPKGATIIVDGKRRSGKSPDKFTVPLGKHTITLKLDGYDDATIPFESVASNPFIVEQTFTKQGKITVDEQPSEFKTYTNDKYKYRIKYPSSWKPDSESPEVVNFFNENRAAKPEALRWPFVETAAAHGEDQSSLSILTQPNPGNLSPVDWYKARPEYSQEDQSQIKTKELTVNGRPAFQFETPYGFAPYLNTIVTGNGQAFILQQIQGSPERSTYDQVIQTFTLF